MNPSLLIISGWAHGIDTIRPMGDALADHFKVQLMTGAQVLSDQHIPDVDYIIAHSMGGLLAIERLPKCCKKLALISSTAKFCASEGYNLGIPQKILRRMILQLKRNPEAVLSEFFHNVHAPNTSHTFEGVILSKTDAEESLNTLVEGLEYLQASDVRQKVPSLGIPILLLHGTDDQIVPLDAAKWLNAHLPDSRLKIFKDAGHALSAHHFDKVMDEISRFL